ncbi:hypothetical protein GpartN1_g5861.t1 [Galdieria partita]|uniref:Uncharacterized protein n=1 Tax=Galdieria partita TaxID=83374 RepID=A0A9C7Q1B3_9RHOD|nr:hypothetical protein GpartN1_g5861.t1 [Galdieria partita]
MSYSADCQRRRLFSPLSTISPNQANVTPAKRAVTDMWSDKYNFRQISLYEKENIDSFQERVFSGERQFQSVNDCCYEKTSSPQKSTGAKTATKANIQTEVYPILIHIILQGKELFPWGIMNERALSFHSFENLEQFELHTVELVQEAQDFIQNSIRKILDKGLPRWTSFHIQDSFHNFKQRNSTLENIYIECSTSEPRKQRVLQTPSFEQILDHISTTNKILESQVEDEESVKNKIHIYKSARCIGTNAVNSIDSVPSQLLDKALEEELFYSIESYQIENQKLRFEIEQVEQELQEILYLREIENLAAEATISEKNEELSRLRDTYSCPKSSFNGDAMNCDPDLCKSFGSKSHVENVDCFETPKLTRKFGQQVEHTPDTIIDTRRRLRACIDHLLEEKNETTRFEYVERVTYEDRVKQLQDKISEYEDNMHNLSSCLEEKLLELKEIQTEKAQLGEAVEEKTHQLLSSSLQLETLWEEMKERNSETESLRTQLNETSIARKELYDSLQRVNEEVLDLREKVKILQERLDETKAELGEKDTELESLRKEVTRKEEQLVSSYSSLSEMRSKLLKTESDLEQATETSRWQETQYESQINLLTTELRICEDRLEAAKSENKNFLAVIENERADRASLVSEMNKLVEENQRLSHQLTNLHDSYEQERDFAENRKRIATLENELRKKEFEYSILQNDYAELHMKLEIEKDRCQLVDEEVLSLEQKRRQDAERESAELKGELRKLTQFIKKYREKTESKMGNLKMIIFQRDTAVEELKKLHQMVRSSELNGELQERMIQEIVHFFSKFGQPREDCYVSMC